MDEQKKENMRLMALDKLDEFLYNHELRIRIPKEIFAGDVPSLVPRTLIQNLPEEIRVPLADGGNQVTGRSNCPIFPIRTARVLRSIQQKYFEDSRCFFFVSKYVPLLMVYRQTISQTGHHAIPYWAQI